MIFLIMSSVMKQREFSLCFESRVSNTIMTSKVFFFKKKPHTTLKLQENCKNDSLF